MPIVTLSAVSRRRLVELLAEARARTVLLVSPLSDEDMSAQPDDAVRPVLSELEQIVQFEDQWLGQGSAIGVPGGTLPAIESYDHWFDAMMEIRQRTLERLESVDEHASQQSGEHRCRIVLEHEYSRGEALI